MINTNKDEDNELYTCEFCGYTSLWEDHDDIRGEMWGCEICGKAFCSKCLQDAVGQESYMWLMQEGGEIMCPDCAKKYLEKGRAG